MHFKILGFFSEVWNVCLCCFCRRFFTSNLWRVCLVLLLSIILLTTTCIVFLLLLTVLYIQSFTCLPFAAIVDVYHFKKERLLLSTFCHIPNRRCFACLLLLSYWPFNLFPGSYVINRRKKTGRYLVDRVWYRGVGNRIPLALDYMTTVCSQVEHQNTGWQASNVNYDMWNTTTCLQMRSRFISRDRVKNN